MRPGRFHPGNFRPPRDKWQTLTSRFNEAGAFPPRKSHHQPQKYASYDRLQ